MTSIDIKAFYEEQIKWYKHETEWDTKQIEWYTEALQKSRKEDREFIEWVQQNPNYTDEEKAGMKSFVSSDTKQNLAIRRRYYLMRKRDRAQLAKYEKMLASL